MIPNPTQRFTGRVESYRRYRPTYPPAVVDLLTRECGLTPESTLADIAAGTGLLTEIFLAAGFAVTAVEPNEEMRAACAALEARYPKLSVRNGTAEATALPDHSTNLITVAQAMHWFDLERTRTEFLRILKPGGCCAVIYNNRRLGGDRFHDTYEQFLLEFGTDYAAVKQQHVGRKRLAQFFAPAEMQCATLPNPQALTLEALEGRVLSSSYSPQPGHPRFEPMRTALAHLFAENASGGTVTLHHDCVVCYGRLA
ncbi:MAG TPA: class I SAM-dependent methyltransferase [Acidobacteriaceae bacterium]|jgi:ubiquinone/menaquinone biosynthesis C-methylase UbiE|nr:class I SAM-dependent methyltransferase [Acidobacteriaceae bacterium]